MLRDLTCARVKPTAVVILHGASTGSVGRFLFSHAACRVFMANPKAELFQLSALRTFG